MPVRSWASTLASFHGHRSYSCRVCFPGSAASTRLACLPTFSGKTLLVPARDRAISSVVDFIRGTYACGVATSWVAARACSFARPNSWLSSLAGTQRMLSWFPCLGSLLISLYIWQICSWPDCCRGFLSVRAAALLLVSSEILYCFSPESVLNADAIAASSPSMDSALLLRPV
jgi:hypothetical protein